MTRFKITYGTIVIDSGRRCNACRRYSAIRIPLVATSHRITKATGKSYMYKKLKTIFYYWKPKNVNSKEKLFFLPNISKKMARNLFFMFRKKSS
jgi:hypothetical protein